MNKISSCSIALFCTLFLIFAACSAQTPPVNVDAAGIALKGYDPVAYFTMGRPVKGQQELQHEWQGARWLFASREHLSLFKENPEKYAPQYGGY